MDTLKIVGALEKRAKAVGLSMAAVCRRANVAQSTVTRWKQGTFDPRVKILARIEAVLIEAEEEKARSAPPRIEPDRVLAAQA